jgi:hypothetical protein
MGSGLKSRLSIDNPDVWLVSGVEGRSKSGKAATRVVSERAAPPELRIAPANSPINTRIVEHGRMQDPSCIIA